MTQVKAIRVGVWLKKLLFGRRDGLVVSQLALYYNVSSSNHVADVINKFKHCLDGMKHSGFMFPITNIFLTNQHSLTAYGLIKFVYDIRFLR